MSIHIQKPILLAGVALLSLVAIPLHAKADLPLSVKNRAASFTTVGSMAPSYLVSSSSSTSKSLIKISSLTPPAPVLPTIPFVTAGTATAPVLSNSIAYNISNTGTHTTATTTVAPTTVATTTHTTTVGMPVLNTGGSTVTRTTTRPLTPVYTTYAGGGTPAAGNTGSSLTPVYATTLSSVPATGTLSSSGTYTTSMGYAPALLP